MVTELKCSVCDDVVWEAQKCIMNLMQNYKYFHKEIDLFNFLSSAYVCVKVEMGSIIL